MRRTAMITAFTLLVATLVLAIASPAPAPVLPPAFQLVDHPTGQAPNNLTDFAWLEDAGLLTSGTDGTITFVPPGGSPRVVTRVPDVRDRGDHGLLGLALSNDYATTGHVYLTYDKGSVTGTGFGMVEEWTASPPANPTSFTLSRTRHRRQSPRPQLAMTSPNHGIDSVVVAPDDTLFVTIGDDTPANGTPETRCARRTRRRRTGRCCI